MILVSVVTTSAREVEWVTRAMGRVFPREWEAFRDVRAGGRARRQPRSRVCPVAARPRRRGAGARSAAAGACGRTRTSRRCPATSTTSATTTHGSGCASLASSPTTGPTLRSSRRASFCATPLGSRASPACWSPASSTSADRPTSRGELAKRWPDAELVLVDDAGHGAGHRTTESAIVAATTRFARSAD